MISPRTNNRSSDTPILLPPEKVWDRIDPLASNMGVEPSVAGLRELPYAQLLGPGFERLCYELLTAEGHSPRFFGRSGQHDYGVDIVVEAGDTHTVYQCKNFTDAPSWSKVRDAVTKFESDWLNKAGLPHPDTFVYCCPHSLDDAKFGEAWTRLKAEFKQRTGVNISFYDKRALDTHLRRLPDIVAGLFSSSYAEHFCNRDDWMDDPWIRIHWGEARYASIKRFLDRHRHGTIHVAAQDEEHFQEVLSSSSVLVIRGLPGSGKTLTGLELACGLRAPLRRIYYATFKDTPDPHRLWKSVGRRGSLPAVMLLDDCHLNLEQTGIVQERLRYELPDSKGDVKLILVLRDVPGSTAEIVDTPNWLVQLDQDGLVMDMKTNLERTREVLIHLHPNLTGLSKQRLERLHYLSGGDLMLLDEILSKIESPQDLDAIQDLNAMRQHKLYNLLREQYFHGNRELPTVQRLACLAQFELTPLASFFDDGWQTNEKTLMASLMTELFAPHRYQFLHSSLAELVLRALLALEVEPKHIEDAVLSTTESELIAYFRHLAEASKSGASRDSEFMQSIKMMLHSRLKLTEGTAEAQMKAKVLNEKFIRNSIEHHLNDCSFSFLHVCLVVLTSVSHPAKEHYAKFIEHRFHMLFENAPDGCDSAGMATIGTGFMTLARNAPSRLKDVQDKFGPVRFLRLIIANGTLSELFRILQYATPTFREELLGQLDEDSAEELVSKTITAGRSIGTLNLALRELGNADEVLLGRLEQTIGAVQFLRLIAANGTLFELFGILQRTTPTFREELLGQFDEAKAEELIGKTITTGRSIGTLNLALRELGNADEVLLGRLEQTIGAVQFLRLIAANGTLFELFRILQRTTPTFREELLGQFDEAKAEELIGKTIAAGRSIGTLHLALRELGNADEVLLGRLEQTIGAMRLLRLIVANGTLFELLHILQYTTPTFRKALLGQLDEASAKKLVDKTIAAGRSIGTLHLALRKLGNADEVLLGRLEQTIGAMRFLRLIAANGTLFELLHILRYTTPTFREELLGQFDEASAKELVDKTIAAGRSIESFHYTMRQLCHQPDHRKQLEKLLGIDGWWRLFIGVGTLNSLIQITRSMSAEFRNTLLSASTDLTIADWQSIIGRGLFLNACTFAVEELNVYPEPSQAAFHKALGETAAPLAAKATWFDLNPSCPLVVPNLPEGKILQAALRPRIEGLKPEDLLGLDFQESVNALAFAWRERPDLRLALAPRLWEILPEPADWPQEEGKVAMLRFVLVIVCSDLVAIEDAHQLLEGIHGFLTHSVCAEIDTFPLFLLLWNVCAVHYERGVSVTHSFEGALPDSLIQTLLEVLRQRVVPKGSNNEKLAQLALSGLISFLVPRLAKELRSILAPLAGIIKWLYPEALAQTFLPALFSLEAIHMLKPSVPVFTPSVLADLLVKSKEYEDIGPAIEFLRQHVEHRANLS